MSNDAERGNPRLVDKIAARIAAGEERAISFHDYMQMCLYDDEFGYYTRNSAKIGKQGDFYTSAGIGGLMGAMLARFALRETPAGETVRIVEWGGGTGAMAAQILGELKAFAPGRYETAAYTIVEISPHHRDLQRHTLREHAERVRVMAPEDWKQSAGDGYRFIFSNELLDSFPVYRVRQKNGRLFELFVGCDDEGRFVERERPCERNELIRYMENGGIRLLDGQTADLCPGAAAWVGERLAELADGLLVTIDYGDTAQELFAPHRMNGTLLCYRRHTASDDPYRYAGEQDMTAHVDFSACMRAGEEQGTCEQRMLTQREFLVQAGIFELLQDHRSPDPFAPEAKRNRAIRQLLLSDQMSELFKVLVQKKRR